MARLTAVFVALVRRFLPDPFVYAALLTFVALLGALLAGPASGATVPASWPEACLVAWFAGAFKILEFAMQMALMLVAGHALAEAPVVHRGLEALASRARNPQAALAVTVLVSLFACWLNWGFGLVVAALLAREMARNVAGLDFALVVAAAYSGFSVWASGLSSSIALTSATHGHALNFIEKQTGHVAPLSSTLFAPFNLVPVLVCAVALPLIFFLQKPAAEAVSAQEALKAPDVIEAVPAAPEGLAGTLEKLPLTTALALVVFAYLGVRLARGQLSPDLNTVIALFLALGMLLQPRALAYVRAWNKAAKSVGPLLLQYPLYGGIMGLISASSLVERLAHATAAVSTRHSFALLVFLSSNVVSLFVPSGGGHWAVQGPIVLPAAAQLGVSPAATAMAVAMGEQTANMIQPFWALPILAIAGLGVRDVMGYCVLTFLVTLSVFGLSLVIFT
ncbi:MAG: short-chain fatty acid transporter [Deltaproteobacteria bacterium]|nr:short-chain fatty acid transporter [Deltaproteobacteria bacterium]